MANPSQDASSKSQGSTEPGHLYGDRDPVPEPTDPTMPAGAMITPPPRGGDDDEQ